MDNVKNTSSIMVAPDGQSADVADLEDVDGRTMRRRRNRQAVIQALIDLIREGDLDPTVAKIADRAQVSHRSIFRYFDDLTDLARTAIETEFVNSLPDAMVPDVGTGTLDARIDRLVATRLRVLARTDRLLQVARAKALIISDLARGLKMAAGIQRDQIRRHFADELASIAHSGGDANSVALTAAVLVSHDAYDQLHRYDGLTDEEIRTTWTAGLHRLFDE